jgi:hypothetical protein
MPNQVAGDLLHTMACYELSRVRTELYNLFVIPFLAPHPEQTDGEFVCHGYLGNPGSRRIEPKAADQGRRAKRGVAVSSMIFSRLLGFPSEAIWAPLGASPSKDDRITG